MQKSTPKIIQFRQHTCARWHQTVITISSSIIIIRHHHHASPFQKLTEATTHFILTTRFRVYNASFAASARVQTNRTHRIATTTTNHNAMLGTSSRTARTSFRRQRKTCACAFLCARAYALVCVRVCARDGSSKIHLQRNEESNTHTHNKKNQNSTSNGSQTMRAHTHTITRMRARRQQLPALTSLWAALLARTLKLSGVHARRMQAHSVQMSLYIHIRVYTTTHVCEHN